MAKDYSENRDLVKTFSEVYRDFHAKLDDKDQEAYDIWYYDIDQKIFKFKHYIYNYIQENEAHLSQKSRKSVAEATEISS